MEGVLFAAEVRLCSLRESRREGVGVGVGVGRQLEDVSRDEDCCDVISLGF